MNIWTDGSCLGNGKTGAQAGYGVYFENNILPRISKRLKGQGQTNNRAELYAAYAALKRVYYRWQPCKIKIHSDNMITVDTINQRRKMGSNWDIIAKIYKLQDILIDMGYDIEAEWVKGHSGDKGNEIADLCAKAGSRKPSRK